MKIDKINVTNYEKSIVLGSETVKVKQYLSSDEKTKIIEAITEECLNVKLIDQVKLDALFNAFVILNYTDIEIDDKFRDVKSLLLIYDYFESIGYMSLIIEAIPKVEFESLIEYLKYTIEDYNKLKVSAVETLESLVIKLPILMEEINKQVKDFDWSSLGLIKDILTQFSH